MSKDEQSVVAVFVVVVVLFLAGVGGYLYLMPQYRVWQQGLAGQAELARAEQNKQIMIETAKAEVEAAKLRAEANQIVGKSAQEYPEYRLQEFMGAFGEAMNNGSIQKIVYVPTEANIPIMEAGK